VPNHDKNTKLVSFDLEDSSILVTFFTAVVVIEEANGCIMAEGSKSIPGTSPCFFVDFS
jgi:hypothetical protein